MQAKNRLRYLVGVLLGCAIMVPFGFVLASVPGFTQALIPSAKLPLVLLFAFMGTLTSIATSQLALVEPDLDAHRAECLADALGCLRILRGVTKEYGVRRLSHQRDTPDLIGLARTPGAFRERHYQAIQSMLPRAATRQSNRHYRQTLPLQGFRKWFSGPVTATRKIETEA